MIKDTIIALLGAALIQPMWSLAAAWWEIAVAYLMTFALLFTVVVNIDECLEKRRIRNS